MSANNDFIAFLHGQMYSDAVSKYLELIEHRLSPIDEDDQRIGTLSQDEMHLWVLWVMADEDLAKKNRAVLSLTADLQGELEQSDAEDADNIKARYNEPLNKAQVDCDKAMRYEFGIRLVFFGALAIAYGINQASGDEVYQVRKGFVLVQVPAEHGDSEAIEFVKDRAVMTTSETAYTGQ